MEGSIKPHKRHNPDPAFTLPPLSTPTSLLVTLQARSVSPFTPRGPALSRGLRHKTPLQPRGTASGRQKAVWLGGARVPDTEKRKNWLNRQLRHYKAQLSAKHLQRLAEGQVRALLDLHRRRQRAVQTTAVQVFRVLQGQVLLRAVGEQRVRMHLAAFRIQLQWKKYLTHVKRPQEARSRLQSSALVIQRHYRGYMVRERLKALKLMKDVDAMYRHYQGIKRTFECEKGMKILMLWRRYKLTQRLLQRAETKRQAPEAPPSPPLPSKWDFKPLINKADTQRQRPSFIKTNPSWRAKVISAEPQTPSLMRNQSKEEPALVRQQSREEPSSPAFRRLKSFNKPSKRSSTSSTEPSTPMSSGLEIRVKDKVLVAGLDRIDEIEV